MSTGLLSKFSLALGISFFVACSPAALSQQVVYAVLQPETISTVSPLMPVQPAGFPASSENHRFLDRENSFLFAATAVFNAADFVVTRDNLRSGGRELNPITRPFTSSTPLLAMNFAGQTAGSIGLSYLFHKTGHHKLERLTSMLSISTSGAAVTYDLTHR